MSDKIDILIMVICYGLAFLLRSIPRNEKEEEMIYKIVGAIFLIGAISMGFVFLMS